MGHCRSLTEGGGGGKWWWGGDEGEEKEFGLAAWLHLLDLEPLNPETPGILKPAAIKP